MSLCPLCWLRHRVFPPRFLALSGYPLHCLPHHRVPRLPTAQNSHCFRYRRLCRRLSSHCPDTPETSSGLSRTKMINDNCNNKIHDDMSTNNNITKMAKSRQRGSNLTSHLLAKQLFLTLPPPTRGPSLRAPGGGANFMTRLPPCRSRGVLTQPLP